MTRPSPFHDRILTPEKDAELKLSDFCQVVQCHYGC